MLPGARMSPDGASKSADHQSPSSPLIFGPTVYEPNCGIFCGQTQQEVFTNTGQAELIADLVGFTGSPAFSGPGASAPPDRFAQGTSLIEPVTFRPTRAFRSRML